MGRIYYNITKTIGATPLVKFNRSVAEMMRYMYMRYPLGMDG
jgi:hypothetical protein